MSPREEHGSPDLPTGTAPATTVVSLDDPVAARQAAPTGMDHRQVRVTGRYDHAAEILLREGAGGSGARLHVVTPLLPLRGDSAVLVDRGVIRRSELGKAGLAGIQEPGVREVTGVALALIDSGLPVEPLDLNGLTTWGRVDLGALRERLPYPVRGFLLRQLPGPGLPPLPRRTALVEASGGVRLQRAVLWFALAAMALLGTAFVRSGSRGG